MLQKQPVPKERRKVLIPQELREALREANWQIQESKRDPGVRVDYDDAIQFSGLIGGRIGDKRRPFEFTYRHRIGDETGLWHLSFHPLEIEDIADGRMTELLLYCCPTPGCGYCSRDQGHTCQCDYVEDVRYGTKEFPAAQGMLDSWGITGLNASSRRADVIAKLGPPTLTGGGEKHEALGYISPWIKYHRADCQLRFSFAKDNMIRDVSVMEADWKPGK